MEDALTKRGSVRLKRELSFGEPPDRSPACFVSFTNLVHLYPPRINRFLGILHRMHKLINY